ncbi:hypothetical protein C1645_816980 [Glomus cerebriforme]|uniref:Uncharacterized protein n=1 Tax=Glomus cerebriforme TaxID=658196 RepID=A0A397TFU8_9GLOM|nr:hypothetical protein C1645_816980 [Glomus cerebriforme]
MSILSYRRNKKNADPKYQESLAHAVKDIILGNNHTAHPKNHKKAKKAVKALQNQTTAQGMINVLKAMPDPIVPSVEVTVVEEEEIISSQPSKSSNKNKKESSVKIKKEKVKINPPSTSSIKIFKPPLDSISAYVYWWGYEIYVPQKCMGRLDQAQNVSNSFLGFLQVVAGNAAAISPYFGFISAWVGLQFTVIKAQNVGNGVVLAATWVLPVAVIPRPWDAPL